MNQIINNAENQEKAKKARRIQFKFENNITIHFSPNNLITDFEVTKDDGEEEMMPLRRDFALYEKILKRGVSPYPILKKFNQNDIKINKEYVSVENLEEKDIVPELNIENEEDIKELEKSLEKSIDKSFDKSYEKSFDKSNNQSINQSYNQSLTISYYDNYSSATGRGIIQKLKDFSDSVVVGGSKNEDQEDNKEEGENEEKEKYEDDDEYNYDESKPKIDDKSKEEYLNEEGLEEEEESNENKCEEESEKEKNNNDNSEDKQENLEENEDDNKDNSEQEEENIEDKKDKDSDGEST